jgi:hypothetical protein
MNGEHGPSWRTLLWGGLAIGLAIALALKAVDAHGRNAALYRKLKAAQAELDRVEGDERRMRSELKALNEDPIYRESVLDRPVGARSNEPVVEK